MKVGIVFGCFIPMHVGHLRLIERAGKENEQMIIAVCGYDGDRGEGFLPFRERIELMDRWISSFINRDRGPRDTGYLARPVAVCVDDHKIGLTGTFSEEAWRTWGGELFLQSRMSPDENEFTWYMGEERYVEKLSKIYPAHWFVLAGRDGIRISGTEIRENWRKHEQEIAPVFLERLREKFGRE